MTTSERGEKETKSTPTIEERIKQEAEKASQIEAPIVQFIAKCYYELGCTCKKVSDSMFAKDKVFSIEDMENALEVLWKREPDGKGTFNSIRRGIISKFLPKPIAIQVEDDYPTEIIEGKGECLKVNKWIW